jgi:hypothetical protein
MNGEDADKEKRKNKDKQDICFTTEESFIAISDMTSSLEKFRCRRKNNELNRKCNRIVFKSKDRVVDVDVCCERR